MMLIVLDDTDTLCAPAVDVAVVAAAAAFDLTVVVVC
jgi:hypothetical protein